MLAVHPVDRVSADQSGCNAGRWIGLQSGSEVEAAMATELRALQRKYDAEPWILTRTILIDENQLPHSHPILTIQTRHIGDPLGLLATFVHEQLHWLEEGPWLESFRAAMTDLEDILLICVQG